jgi:hypothetical protein
MADKLQYMPMSLNYRSKKLALKILVHQAREKVTAKISSDHNQATKDDMHDTSLDRKLFDETEGGSD